MPTKLHELLAVEGDLKGRAQITKNQTVKLFTDGTGRLLGRTITYQVDEGEDSRPPEITELATTAQEELDRFQADYGKWLDIAIQKEATNQEAAETVTVDGVDLFGEPLPATALLNIESKLVEIRSTFAAVPTLDPSERWEWSEIHSHYVSGDRATNITKKVPKVLVLAEATEHHPAQVQSYHEDVKTGIRTTTLHSGLMSVNEKRKILDRIDKLMQAVKQARQRANSAEVVSLEVAKTIFDFIRE